MFYIVDDDGNIIMSDDMSLFPDEYEDLLKLIDSDEELTVSSGDELSYDYLVDLFAYIPGYNVYPNTNAVNVFEYVVNSLDGHFGYVVLSGADTNSTYLYYSKDFEVIGNVIYLYAPVTFCNYYSYRPSSSSSYVYTYTVNTVSDVNFTLSNQLVYTNLMDGYPDLLPYKSNESYSFLIIIAFLVFMCFALLFKNVRKAF